MQSQPTIRESNYIRKIKHMFALGQLPIGVGVADLYVYHDDDCKIFSGGLCDCDPDIKLKILWSPTMTN